MYSLSKDGIINPKLIDIINAYGREEIESLIDYNKDYNFDYFAFKSLLIVVKFCIK